MRCQKCSASVNADQAFCSKCGAVVGMSDTDQKGGDEWNMAATMVGKKMPIPESSRPTVVRQAPPADIPRPTPPPQEAYTPSPQPPTPMPQPARSSSNAMLLAIIGLVAVLLIGGLLALLFYLNSQG
ncbi:MAG: zinc ribbon domain-containing protein [Rubrivivax sp.]|nr:zinc ribbon domain-containing protein [Pyrinomonadaceae bacterium]